MEGNGFYSSSCMRIGQLISLAKEQYSMDSSKKYKILTMIAHSKGYAEVKEALVSKEWTAEMPLLAILRNIWLTWLPI